MKTRSILFGLLFCFLTFFYTQLPKITSISDLEKVVIEVWVNISGKYTPRPKFTLVELQPGIWYTMTDFFFYSHEDSIIVKRRKKAYSKIRIGKVPFSIYPMYLKIRQVAQIPDTNLFLAVAQDDGYERSLYCFSLWRRVQGQFEYVGLLNDLMTVGLGGVKILEVIRLNSKKVILIGKDLGGDGGDYFEQIWVRKIILPAEVKLLGKLGFQTSFYENDFRLVYSIDQQEGEIKIVKYKSKFLNYQISVPARQIDISEYSRVDSVTISFGLNRSKNE